jgi:hypothetical protein
LQIDWPTVIDDLERAGVSLRSQAVTVEVSLGTIYYWRSGGEPKYRNGRMLLNLYERHVGNEAPIVSRFTQTTPVEHVSLQTLASSTSRSASYASTAQLQATHSST